MSWSETEHLRARHVVEARLGRPPQDMLEAAVVLEAFKGLPAAEALATGRQIMASTPREPQASVAEVPSPRAEEHFVLEALAFVLAVISIACWAGPLSDDLGATTVQHAVIMALPLTLADITLAGGAIAKWTRGTFRGEVKRSVKCRTPFVT